jgi:hypothetical protein
LVVDWLKTLRLPPYEAALPVLAKGTRCPHCGPASGRSPAERTTTVFPGGWRVKCGTCDFEWLVDE